MIALALSCRPAVLLADERTTALDVTVQIQIIVLLRRLQQELGMAVIFVTHDVGVAVEISDRLAVMYAGRFVETGPTATLIEHPAHPYTAGLLASTVLGSEPAGVSKPLPGRRPIYRRCRRAAPLRRAGLSPRAEPAPTVIRRREHETTAPSGSE